MTMMTIQNPLRMLCAVLLPAAVVVADSATQPGATQDLRQALTFYSSFDGSTTAAVARGDKELYNADTLKQRTTPRTGLPPSGEVQHAPGAGRFGDALRFTAKKSPVVFYKGGPNLSYRTDNWSGTVSFWLHADLAALEPGFCDPVQITPRAWNDAAFFVEFEKRPESIPFRLGVYADLDVWNPSKRRIADIPPGERPLVTVDNPPFGRGKWTHVAFTFERFNTGKSDGVARLYLDGVPRGTLSARQQTFTWNPDENIIALGLSYIGLIDDVALFDRAFTEAEVQRVFALEKGIATLLK